MASVPGEEAAVDPFGFIDREYGPISPSLEEHLFRLSPFISDNPPLSPLSPLPPADAPILICSLPDEQSPPPPPPPQETNNNKGESSSKETAANISTKTKNKKDKKKEGKRRRRLMGAQLRTSSSDTDGQEEPTQRPPEPEVPPPPPPPVTTTRKLPESILKQNSDRRDASGQYSKEEATDVAPTEPVHKPPCDLVVTLEDVVRKYSRRPDTSYDHMSLLEIAEMKGFFDRTS